MKGNIKLVIAFILGAVIFGCIGAYAATMIQSSDVLYNDTNVEAALNGLYTTQNTTVSTLTTANSTLTSQNESLTNQISSLQAQLNAKISATNFGTPTYTNSQGNQADTRVASINLTKGKYLVVMVRSWAGLTGSNLSETDENLKYVECSSNNCVVEAISGHKNQLSATTAVTGSSKVLSSSIYALDYVEIKENNDTISYTWTCRSDVKTPQALHLTAIPINE